MLREHFPTAKALELADPDELLQAGAESKYVHFTREHVRQLQALAAQSIGVTERARQDALVLVQAQLISELRLLQEHLDAIDARITDLLAQSREGRILLSMPGIGTVSAAAILAAIGRIDNFPTASALKAYFGWAPRRDQSGQTRDRAALMRGGQPSTRRVLYLVALRSIRISPAWAGLYDRLVVRKCPYDERLGRRTGKNVVVGRIAGQIIVLQQQLS